MADLFFDTTSQSHQFLHSYCIRPDVKFEAQAKDEHIILVLRAHPITFLPWIFNSLVFFIALIVLDFILPNFLTANQVIFINIFALILLFSYIFFNFLSWFFNVGIITNQRIIDIDFDNVIYKEVTETNFSRIQDITSKSGGFFEAFFNYGNLFVQTAASEQNIEFLNIPSPSDVVRIIEDLTGK